MSKGDLHLMGRVLDYLVALFALVYAAVVLMNHDLPLWARILMAIAQLVVAAALVSARARRWLLTPLGSKRKSEPRP